MASDNNQSLLMAYFLRGRILSPYSIHALFNSFPVITMASTRAAAAAASAAIPPTNNPASPLAPHPYTSFSHSIEKRDMSMGTG